MSGRLVSVIIPVYNVVSFLSEAIQSALTQDYADIQIVVVNDGSNAEASAAIEAICATDKRIVLVSQPNQGPAAARRKGIAHAGGDYVMFLDADDRLLPGAVSHLVSVLEENPSAVASYGSKIFMEKDMFDHTRIFPAAGHAVSGDILPALLVAAPLLSNGNICIRRRIIERVAFPEGIRQGEDWITWCRLALLGDILYAGDRVVVCIRTHDDNVSNRVLSKPSALFRMLPYVFEDKRFAERIGQQQLAVYRIRHICHLHTYFYASYTRKKQYIRAYWHKTAYRFYSRKLETMQKKEAVIAEPIPKKDNRIRVLHIVKWFYAGGAERMVSAVLQHSDHCHFDHMVLSLSDQGERMETVRHSLGIPYYSIDIARDKMNLRNYIRCLVLIWRARPDVVKTWLPPSNIDGGRMGRLLGIPVIWGIHNALPPTHAWEFKQLALSRFVPTRIICCSQPVYNTCVTYGYNPRKLQVITNGTDTDVFSPRLDEGKRLRMELGIDEGVVLIGMAAEVIPIKRHSHFLAAAALLLAAYPEARFLFCGRDATHDNPMLKKRMQELSIEKHVHLLGIRDDMADIYSALTIHTLNSSCESFGLAITEAMACETLCVATDVGIARELLKDVGEVISVSDDPHVLADAWKRLLGLTEAEKDARRERGRFRIMQSYSISETAKQYDETYLSVYNQVRNKR